MLILKIIINSALALVSLDYQNIQDFPVFLIVDFRVERGGVYIE